MVRIVLSEALVTCFSIRGACTDGIETGEVNDQAAEGAAFSDLR